MLGSRFTAMFYVDGILFTNQLVNGDSGNNKRCLIKRVIKNFKEIIYQDYIKKHKITIQIHDRQTNNFEYIEIDI